MNLISYLHPYPHLLLSLSHTHKHALTLSLTIHAHWQSPRPHPLARRTTTPRHHRPPTTSPSEALRLYPRSLDQIQWNFSLSDLTTDLSNLGDLGALGNYTGSPFMQSDSDILMESSDEKDIVDDFFVNTEPHGSQSDEERS
ncbi:uncharacterized protein LOC130736358 [Lotus japonicus]|uniref:uncharacterized protein LOC130736358 n=1 Tax=Lotus japonicus TaxID=34305 RepID=UPI0025878DC1|nr:uncharacterized protein LOC130736358 [Lotus japonicus]